ncbi:putative lipid II flippase FtsW [Rhodococcus sp. HNM0569]|uniref:putative lipid II flippase FtsW n=1 Tax=Rhodococcus sp. HNM0569 TaxID=2716340 RepID=UPI00146F431A|nr:putative lipid II flippase FtsW [Rhodococcus sp. HNM0569]NLU82920.1 putative lipid II flippase FtsW [Rhodococcus sp. HNM0569]
MAGTPPSPRTRAGAPAARNGSTRTRAPKARGRSPKAAAEGAKTRSGSAASSPRSRIGAWLAHPLASFHLIVTVAFLLTGLGLVMVLSASSVEQYAAGGSAYSLFVTQAIFAVVGAVLFYLALRMPVRVWRQWSFPLFAVCMVMLVLVLVPGIGTEVQGSQRWFQFGGFSLQPSELTKVALALWGAHLLASRRPETRTLKSLLVPLVPAGLIACVLVVLQPNLSTTIALGIILGALLWFGGLPVRLFAAIGIGGVVAAGVLAVTAGYRSNRVKAFFNPGADPQGIGYQSRQASFSLADGGWFGRGLGQSRAKWSYLPNSHNDFIFAIIGEELGLVGCLAVLGLFGLFVYTGLRIAARSVDPFLRLLTATATTWILAQGMINIGYVIGLLPVTGLQLPLVSAGGSSLAITLVMVGIIASAARHEPEAIAALRAGQDGRFSKLLRLPKPEPYVPVRPSVARAEAVRRAEDRRSSGRAARASAPRAATYGGPKEQQAVRDGRGRPARGGRPGQGRARTSRTGERGYRR